MLASYHLMEARVFVKSADELPADFGSIDGCCPDVRDKRIADLEAERDDLRQRLIGGVTLTSFATGKLGDWSMANEAYLQKPKT